eukprot:211910-Prorocentrum_minimum.AAC.1
MLTAACKRALRCPAAAHASAPPASTPSTCTRLVRRENIPARPASDLSVVRVYPRVLRPIGPS